MGMILINPITICGQTRSWEYLQQKTSFALWVGLRKGSLKGTTQMNLDKINPGKQAVKNNNYCPTNTCLFILMNTGYVHREFDTMLRVPKEDRNNMKFC